LWRGVFIHKNLLALVLPLASVALYISAASSLRWRHWYWCWFWLALLLLTLSGSKSSLLGYMVLFFGISVYLALARQGKLLIPALLSVLVAGTSLTAQVGYNLFPSAIYAEIRSQLADSGGDSASSMPGNLQSRLDEMLRRIRMSAPDSGNPKALASASGRLDLWRELWAFHQKKPWLGYGFGGFWLEAAGPSKQVWQSLKWKPRAAHDGYMDLLLELGYMGLFLFIAGFCLTLYRAMRQLPMTSFEPVRLYFPTVLIYLLLANIGESALFTPNLFLWVCYVAAAVSLLHPPIFSTRENG
jgi:O-antigen ligase